MFYVKLLVNRIKQPILAYYKVLSFMITFIDESSYKVASPCVWLCEENQETSSKYKECATPRFSCFVLGSFLCHFTDRMSKF